MDTIKSFFLSPKGMVSSVAFLVLVVSGAYLVQASDTANVQQATNGTPDTVVSGTASSDTAPANAKDTSGSAPVPATSATVSTTPGVKPSVTGGAEDAGEHRRGFFGNDD